MVMTDIPRQLVSSLLNHNVPTHAFITNCALTIMLKSFYRFISCFFSIYELEKLQTLDYTSDNLVALPIKI